MAGLTIRNINESVKKGLRIQAALHGRSMEEEARQILRQAVLKGATGKGLGSFIHQTFAKAVGGADLPAPVRSAPRYVDFSGEDE